MTEAILARIADIIARSRYRRICPVDMWDLQPEKWRREMIECAEIDVNAIEDAGFAIVPAEDGR